ncbi:MAG: hypothetical protein U0871_15650 [Gemmataceae bacterium]
MVIDQSTQMLIWALFNAFENSPTDKPMLPAGAAGRVTAMLTRTMTDPQFGSAYVAALRAERKLRGREVTLRLLRLPCADVSETRVLAEGFAHLSDDVLADLALSAEMLEGLLNVLYDPTTAPPGAWFFAPETFRYSEPGGS